jgi:UDP-GlcNAc:undecaprenyl-phosphate/decaprenyl-phosphate GlcNAc-1-phosphate transferase
MNWWDYIYQVFDKQSQSQPLAFGIALLVSFFLTPLIRERAEKLGISTRKTSETNRETLSEEHKNIPRLGGISILVSIMITVIFYLVFFGRYTPHGITYLALEGILAGAVIIFFIGLLDDIKALNPLIKLGGQILASSVAWALGVKITLLANPIYYIDHARQDIFKLDDLGSLITTVCFLVAITNAINLIDGIDGLAVGVSCIVAIATWSINLSPVLNQPAGAVLAATMAGASLGFLRYNFNPARIFLGDNGSYLLGFILACLACIGLVKKVTVIILSPILILLFAIPLIDTFYAIIRRTLKKQSIIKPDLEHLHHKLLGLGLSTKQVSYAIYLITFLCGLAGTWILGKQIAIDYLIISSCCSGIWLFYSLLINHKRQKFYTADQKSDKP